MNAPAITIRVGHPAYPKTGMNRAAWHTSYSAALRDLLARKVPMKDAHNALRKAFDGSWATAARYYHGTRVESCEIIVDRA